MNNIWRTTLWKKRTDVNFEETQSGLKLCTDKQLDESLRAECRKFAVFLRHEYVFPVRVYVNIKENKHADKKPVISELKIKNNKSGFCSVIKISINNTEQLLHKAGEDKVKNMILECFARELTNYFQWLNQYWLPEGTVEGYIKDALFDYENVREKLGRKYSWHLWDRTNWEYIIDPVEENLQTGIRLFIDREVDAELREACKKFVRYLRKMYVFPIRVLVHLKKHTRILASDGDEVLGLFVDYYDYRVSPDAWIATGDYSDLKEKYGKDNAEWEIFWIIAHELSHYFQWINDVKLTPRGKEWQASWYAGMVIDEYLDYLEESEEKQADT